MPLLQDFFTAPRELDRSVDFHFVHEGVGDDDLGNEGTPRQDEEHVDILGKIIEHRRVDADFRWLPRQRHIVAPQVSLHQYCTAIVSPTTKKHARGDFVNDVTAYLRMLPIAEMKAGVEHIDRRGAHGLRRMAERYLKRAPIALPVSPPE